MVCLCQSEWRSTRISLLAGWWNDPAMLPAWSANVCCRMHKDFNVHLTQCCRFGQGACICNHRCLAERRSSAESNLLRLEEILNLRCIEVIYCPMPRPCLGRVDSENYRAGAAKGFSQSFFYTASEWIQSGHFKILLMMRCSVYCHDRDESLQR